MEGGIEEEYRGLINRFVQWSEDDNLKINVANTKALRSYLSCFTVLSTVHWSICAAVW